jgi:hypothetical protein
MVVIFPFVLILYPVSVAVVVGDIQLTVEFDIVMFDTNNVGLKAYVIAVDCPT